MECLTDFWTYCRQSTRIDVYPELASNGTYFLQNVSQSNEKSKKRKKEKCKKRYYERDSNDISNTTSSQVEEKVTKKHKKRKCSLNAEETNDGTLSELVTVDEDKTKKYKRKKKGELLRVHKWMEQSNTCGENNDIQQNDCIKELLCSTKSFTATSTPVERNEMESTVKYPLETSKSTETEIDIAIGQDETLPKKEKKRRRRHRNRNKRNISPEVNDFSSNKVTPLQGQSTIAKPLRNVQPPQGKRVIFDSEGEPEDHDIANNTEDVTDKQAFKNETLLRYNQNLRNCVVFKEMTKESQLASSQTNKSVVYKGTFQSDEYDKDDLGHVNPVEEKAKEKKDYSCYQLLQGLPRNGDKIAFQILEMSEAYTPEVSDYKEGTVASFDFATNMIEIELSQPEKGKRKQGRFDLIIESEEEILTNVACEPTDKVIHHWPSLLVPRLLS